jgi:predicted acylesterase/phospholipase RssA
MIARQLIVGITNVERVRDFIYLALIAKVHAKDPSVGVTFYDLDQAQTPALKIVATNVYAQSLELFCLERTPDVAIADAVAASICLPVTFRPWTLRFDRNKRRSQR